MNTQSNYVQAFNPGNGFDGANPQFKKKPVMPMRSTIGTDEIKEIVQRLNAKPFNENFTLVTFDELSTYLSIKLLLISLILIKLDWSY